MKGTKRVGSRRLPTSVHCHRETLSPSIEFAEKTGANNDLLEVVSTLAMKPNLGQSYMQVMMTKLFLDGLVQMWIVLLLKQEKY